MNNPESQSNVTLSQNSHASEQVVENGRERHYHQQLTFRAGTTPSLPVQDIIALNQINEEFAHRAIAMAEKEQEFRHSFTMVKEDNIAKERVLGLKLATFVSFMGLMICGLLAYFDHPWVASIFGTGSILGIVTVLVQSSHSETTAAKPKREKQPTKQQ